MSTKFFTNELENTLLKRFAGVFEHQHVRFFDALVGYFRASGYFAIRPYLDKVPNIRILVGINVDEMIAKYQSKGLLFQGDSEQTLADFLKKMKLDIQHAEYKEETEKGILKFIEDIASQKIEIKAHPTKKLHAKIYIFRPENFNQYHSGEVITGSSNLTDAGLGNTQDSSNYEFNVAMRDYDDVLFATNEFEKLWGEAIPILPVDIEKVKKETYINDSFTPFEVYIKFLIEYFGKNVDFDPNSVTDLPEGFLRLSYQIDAVSQGFELLKKHNGFFLSDVVGLGKTIVATLIAKKFFYFNDFPSHITTTLIITPPAIRGSWEMTVRKFGLKNVDFLNNGSLHKIENLEKYDLIIVDEAHKFRNDTAEGYTELQKLCKAKSSRTLPDGTQIDKKVILVSATPLNNRPHDIRNLVFLFKDGKEDNTLEVSNLTNYFSTVIERYKEIKQLPQAKMLKEVAVLYEDVREKIIKPLTIRRTRRDLNEHEEYKKDIEKQGIFFPKVQKPNIVLYQLDNELDDLYDYTAKMLSDEKEGLRYYRYQAIKYLIEEKKKQYKNADLASGQLAQIMKTLLVKRLDSSFYAFKASLGRFYSATGAMLKMFENGRIVIAPKLNVNEYIVEDREEELFQRIAELIDSDPTISICSPDDFSPVFYTGLKRDYEILEELNSRWAGVNKDPKFDKFYEYIQSELFGDKNLEGKLVVFSESKETTHYLTTQLNDRGHKDILTVSSENRRDMVPLIGSNFDANFGGEKKNDFSIILTTEVLAEGVNLHRSNIVVNYDTPWNSTKLMQRVGRVNRIGSKASEVHIYNFYPTTKVEADIELQRKAILKLQAFHSALGEDSEIYSPDEQVSTFGIFDKEVDEDKDERLEYLMELRKFKRESPEDFRKIKNMPLRARVGRKDPIKTNATICFLKNKRRDAFYFVDNKEKVMELTFLQAANQFKALRNEKPYGIHEQHHSQMQTALKDFYEKLNTTVSQGLVVDIKQGPNEKNALSFLTALEKLDFISPHEKQKLKDAKVAIKMHKFQDLQRKVNKIYKEHKKSPLTNTDLLDKAMQVIESFPLNSSDTDVRNQLLTVKDINNLRPEIIISQSFLK